MSSSEFYCDLIPHKRLRQWPLLCGVVALLVGAMLILGMPMPWVLRCLACVGWLTYCVCEIRRFRRAAALLRRLRLRADGSVFGRMADGRWQRLQMLPGSVVFTRCAWLRLADGRDYGELLCGDARDSLQWHRLQLIWRQNRAAFGACQRS